MAEQLVLDGAETEPRRGLFLDWLSLTAHFELDAAVKPLVASVQSAVSDHFGVSDIVPCDFNGNYAEGCRFKRAGIQLRWTKFTTCDLNSWNYEGRCAGTINLICSGKQGIGMLPLDKAMSFMHQLWNLGFRSASRVDLALDIHDYAAVSPNTIYRHLQAGRWAVPRRRDFSLYAGFRQGEEDLQTPTVYLGNIKADNFCRIYDRAVVLGLDHPCTRFERQTRGKFAQVLLESGCGASDASFECPNATHILGRWLLASLRTACDFRDVSRLEKLNANWANRTEAPSVIDRVFGEVAPLAVGDVVVKGGFAASFRHVQRNSARVLALHCVHLMATKSRVANDLLSICGDRLENLTEEDLADLQLAHSELTIYKIRAAWEKCIKQWFQFNDMPEPQVRRMANVDADKLICELGVE